MIVNSSLQNINIKKQEDKKITLTNNNSFFNILAFTCGSLTWHKTSLIGELYTTEILLILAGIIILLSKKNDLTIDNKLFIKYILFGLLLLFGYIFSDLINGTQENQYLRGWGRVILLITDFIFITIIFGCQNKSIHWYFIGYVIGNISILILTGRLNLDNFKFYWSIPALTLLCIILPKISIKITSLALTIAGVLYIILDYRSAGSISIIIGFILFLRSKNNIDTKSIKLIPIFIAIMISGLAIKTALKNTNDAVEVRRESSSVTRIAAIKIGVQAILNSPIIGTGSWGNNTEEYAKALYEDTKEDSRRLGQRNHRLGTSFVAHSQIIQSWMEGGILAASFFIFYGITVFNSLKFTLLHRNLDNYSALYNLYLTFGIWNLIMSPFGGDHRLNIATCIAISIIINKQKLKITYI